MYCLHCGDCCLRMCPMNGGECEFVKKVGAFYFCSRYEIRPKQCANHDFPARFCPVGMSVLGVHDSESIRKRIEEGHQIIKEGLM